MIINLKGLQSLISLKIIKAGIAVNRSEKVILIRLRSEIRWNALKEINNRSCRCVSRLSGNVANFSQAPKSFRNVVKKILCAAYNFLTYNFFSLGLFTQFDCQWQY